MKVRIHALVVAIILTVPLVRADKTTAAIYRGKEVLWKAPNDIQSRDLFYGIGGPSHAPRGPFRFLKEDRDGSNPKYSIEDSNGVKWKVKLGREAQPETAATRFVWAAGYYTDQDYYLSAIHVDGLPVKLHRGRKYIDVNEGIMQGARLELEPDATKKDGSWSWKDNPFIGTREFNGLRTLMALLNNWDVKDSNTAIYESKTGNRLYVVSDLGATFATPGFAFPARSAKNNLQKYQKSSFVCGESANLIDFCAPGRPAIFRAVAVKEFFSRLKLRWIGDDIPRADARWMGEILGHLSSAQIRDAFRGAGYTPDQVEGFARIIEDRIAILSEL